MEVDNMHHYGTTISIIQILVQDTCYLFDFLSPLDPVPLLSILKERELVIHGSDFDLRVLFQKFGFIPKAVFDTMLAAQLTGKKSFGLAALVKHYFGKDLDKEMQKADWSIRPLSDEMIKYAAKDTFFLPTLHEKLKHELDQSERTTWHQEWCRHVMHSSQQIKQLDTENIWRIKGATKLHPKQLQVLKDIWHWREKTAESNNQPVYKVLNNKAMIHLASIIPVKDSQDFNIQKLSLKIKSALKLPLKSIIQRSLEVPAENWPARKKRRRLKGAPSPHPKAIRQLTEIRDGVAHALDLPPSLIAPRESISLLASRGLENRKSLIDQGSIMKWQAHLIYSAWKAQQTPTE